MELLGFWVILRIEFEACLRGKCSRKILHLLLVDLCIFTWMSILESEEKIISFLMEIDLIPSRKLEVFCDKGGAQMVAWQAKSLKVGFHFVCSMKRRTKCSGT